MSIISTRLAKLEKRHSGKSSITNYVKDGWQYIGGKFGLLKVPQRQTAVQWETDYKSPDE